jgi:hypothetical protein
MYTLTTWEMEMTTPSSEEHFENSKISRDSYLYLEILNFEFYLVSRSLYSQQAVEGQ